MMATAPECQPFQDCEPLLLAEMRPRRLRLLESVPKPVYLAANLNKFVNEINRANGERERERERKKRQHLRDILHVRVLEADGPAIRRPQHCDEVFEGTAKRRE
jgi:hypothetical protein